MSSPPPLDFPEGETTYLLHNAFVPECCLDLRGAFGARESSNSSSKNNDDGDATSTMTPSATRTTTPRPQQLLRSESTSPDLDSLVHVDIEVEDGIVKEICRARPRGGVGDAEHDDGVSRRRPIIDASSSMILPCFVDLHTHIDKSHTCERSRNKYGSLSGADRSTARDAELWDEDDVVRRMDFSLRCAFAHGTSALRTHLINMTPRQVELTWPAFDRVRAAWRGRVELQGVSLVALSFFRDRGAAEALAALVASRNEKEKEERRRKRARRDGGGGKNDDDDDDDDDSDVVVGVLGAAVCCAENGGDPDDEWTTCERDRGELLDFLLDLAARHALSVDLHVDENGNRRARGLRDVARAVLRRKERVREEEAREGSKELEVETKTVPFTGTVVCGHCCSLAALTPAELAETVSLVRRAGNITIVSLPLVNEWTQDRDPRGLRAPRWRGIPPLLEIARLAKDFNDGDENDENNRNTGHDGEIVALASDNVRDQFYAYGDLDALEVLRHGVRAAHLDTPYGAWPSSVTRVPARAMRLRCDNSDNDNNEKKSRRRPSSFGAVAVGAPADFVVFRARAYSELLARPQSDRVVVRGGAPINERPPRYEELYSSAAAEGSAKVLLAPPRGFGQKTGYDGRLSPAPSAALATAASAAMAEAEAAAEAAAAKRRNDGGENGVPPTPSRSPPPPPPRGLEGVGVLTETVAQREAAAEVQEFALRVAERAREKARKEREREIRAATENSRASAAVPASPFKVVAAASNGHANNGEDHQWLASSSCAVASSSPFTSSSLLVAAGLVGAAAGAAVAALALRRR